MLMIFSYILGSGVVSSLTRSECGFYRLFPTSSDLWQWEDIIFHSWLNIIYYAGWFGSRLDLAITCGLPHNPQIWGFPRFGPGPITRLRVDPEYSTPAGLLRDNYSNTKTSKSHPSFIITEILESSEVANSICKAKTIVSVDTARNIANHLRRW